MEDAPPSSTSTMATGAPSTELRERHDQLLGAARSATGFMPDDEGEALYLAALRAGASFEGATFMEIGAWCGKSTVYLGAAGSDRRGPVQHRPPPRVRGEPGRLGAPRP